MDFMLRKLSNSTENIFAIMKEICEVETENEYILLEVIGAEQITLEKKYPSVKIKFVGHINNFRVPFSIDIGIDDVTLYRELHSGG